MYVLCNNNNKNELKLECIKTFPLKSILSVRFGQRVKSTTHLNKLIHLEYYDEHKAKCNKYLIFKFIVDV